MAEASLLLLALVFAAAGIAKLRARLTFRSILRDLVPAPLVSPLAVALPILELALAVALFVGIEARATAALTIALLLIFSGALWRMNAAGLIKGCGCFGEQEDATTPAAGLARNAMVIGIAVIPLLEPPEASIFQADLSDQTAAATIAAGAVCLWLATVSIGVNRKALFKGLRS